MFRSLFSSKPAPATHSSGRPRDLDQGHTDELKELLESMTRALVDEPAKIEIDQADSDEGLLFELRVSKSDLGKVIGKKGRTASAMRTILSAASRKHKVGADLKIIE